MSRTLNLLTSCRYRQTDLLQGPRGVVGTEEITFFGTFKRPEILLTFNDAFITIKSKDQGRLDLLAYTHYGDPFLWWVIALVNDIVDPIYGAEPGYVVRLPKRSNIFVSSIEGLL